MGGDERRYRAGETVSDLCRACKATRDHTVMAVDAGGRLLRVVCGFCGSQHNFRGGGERAAPPAAVLRRASAGGPVPPAGPGGTRGGAMSLSGEGPGAGPPGGGELEQTLRRVLREELGLSPVAPAERWRGGELVLRPGRPGLQEKKWPIETFFHKVVMIRNRLRTLEQQVNAAELPEDAKIKMQSYITGCYGSLTSFNVLFADEADHFRGASGED